MDIYSCLLAYANNTARRYTSMNDYTYIQHIVTLSLSLSLITYNDTCKQTGLGDGYSIIAIFVLAPALGSSRVTKCEHSVLTVCYFSVKLYISPFVDSQSYCD